MDSTNESDIKKIIIIEEPKQNTKKVKCQKEKKMRVETNSWGLTEEDLSHEIQLNILKTIQLDTFNKNDKNKYISLFTSHIKSKI